MRQTLFRGKQLHTGVWLYGSLIQRGERCFIVPSEGEPSAKETEVDPKTVGQRTDQLDKKGRWVWEGDMVLAVMLGGLIETLWISWGVRGFIQINDEGERLTDWWLDLEVIGNIHDVPNLVLPEVHDAPEQDDDPWRCRNCGSLAVQQRAWVNVNTEEIESFIDGGRDDYRCEHCEEHNHLVRESELMEKIDKWFAGGLRPEDDEVISGLNRANYASDEEFKSACNEAWNARSNEEKISIWHELTRDKSNDE